MIHCRSSATVVTLVSFVVLPAEWSAAAEKGPATPATITVQADQPGAKISPLLYGIFFEEIHRAGDGGIYAEMIQNRSFEDAAVPLGWTIVQGDGQMSLHKSQPLNANNPTSLRLAGPVRVANHGFKGAPYAVNQDPAKWKFVSGDWKWDGEVLRQTGKDQDLRGVAGKKEWKDYTLTLKARKLGGAEGFLIIFAAPNEKEKSWWNLGGWANKAHGIEARGVASERVPGSIETGRWYDIKIELKARRSAVISMANSSTMSRQATLKSLYAVASRATATGDVILKVVNAAGQPLDTTDRSARHRSPRANRQGHGLDQRRPRRREHFRRTGQSRTQGSGAAERRTAISPHLPSQLGHRLAAAAE